MVSDPGLGDIRMKISGENPKKVANIVHRQLDEFRTIYERVIEEAGNVSYYSDTQLEVMGWRRGCGVMEVAVRMVVPMLIDPFSVSHPFLPSVCSHPFSCSPNT